ncbi:hypothetical protein HPB50_020251 [Hyalomma asiaticum]|uniref:Uncharacterized protein n=1 Tax=Hyalomma asiaticum TaxID=266040 RepID=A0ACB7SYD8_HYAAI|nr:hypothetical protein HPB50_020251 [Hyalomma asiaticum]
METTASVEPGEPGGEDVSPSSVQAPASNEGPISAELIHAPASMKPTEAVDGLVLPHAVRIPTAVAPIEALEDHIWPSPAPMSRGPVEEIECPAWPRPVWTPASVSHSGLLGGHRLPGPGRRRQAQVVMDEQEYRERQQAAGEAREAAEMNGVFPAYRGNAINVSRACLIFVVLVVVVITCYIIATRLIFLAKCIIIISGRLRHERQRPRSPRAPITTSQAETTSSKKEEAMKPGGRRSSPHSMETTASVEPGRPGGEVVSPCSVQAPPSSEGPVSAQLIRAPASMKPTEAMDGLVLPHAVRIPTAVAPIEALEDHIWPSPAPMSRGPIEAIECHAWPRPVWTPASVSHSDLLEEHRLPGPGRRRQAQLVMDEQEYRERQQAAGEAEKAVKMHGIFPAYRGNAINMSRACLIFVILVIVVITCYIIATRLIFLAMCGRLRHEQRGSRSSRAPITTSEAGASSSKN